MKPRRQVALVFPVTVNWLAVLAEGVLDYARQHGDWGFITSPPTFAEADEMAMSVYGLRGWPGDGAIVITNNDAEARFARQLGFPIVCVAGNQHDGVLPRVSVDYYKVGQVAAEHLLQCGLPRLAYYGLSGAWYSQERQRGFVERAARARRPCDVFNVTPITDPQADWQARRGPLDEWLKTLRMPVGILAVHDYRARVVVDECARLGLDVPHDVAVLGVDNDLTVCEFCRPALSSVSRGSWRVGYEAAGVLDRLMNGEPAPTHDILVPPEGVVARRSTDTIAVDDPQVSIAVHFMHDHLGEVFGLEQVMEHVSMSRRWLHEQFRRLLSCTPHQYFCKLRVDRAKQLLSGPQRPKMQKVAASCGFSSAARMRVVFRQVTGNTPQEYFRLHGGRAAAKSGGRARRDSAEPG